MTSSTREQYTVGLICTLYMEMSAAEAIFDERHSRLPKPPSDPNTYTLGRIGLHNVVLACLPAGQMGTTPAATVAAHMSRTFTSIRFFLLIGIGGGIPSVSKEIRLGDVVVGKRVLQYDIGNGKDWEQVKALGPINTPPPILMTAINALRSQYGEQCISFVQNVEHILQRVRSDLICPGLEQDRLFANDTLVQRSLRDPSGPRVYLGNIGCVNGVVEDATLRDHLGKKDKLSCFEMEAAGLSHNHPCVVIRGISDYADKYKSTCRLWKGYASLTAAVYAKELLCMIKLEEVVGVPGVPLSPLSCMVLVNQLFPKASVSLGRLVTNVRSPWQGFCNHPLEIACHDVVTTNQPRMHEILRLCGLSKSYDRLTKLFFSFTGLPFDRLISAPERTYILANSDYYFSKLCSEKDVQTWIGKVLRRRGQHLYMAVGLHTVEVNPTTFTGDSLRSTAGSVLEEKVWAVQYRKVKFTWFRGRSVGNAHLQGYSKWTVVGINGRGDDQDSEEVGVELLDSMSVDDMEDKTLLYSNSENLIVFDS